MNNIKIIFEDDNLLVINKPAGILVHNGKGINTIANWLEEKYPEILKFDWPVESRKGIVHRLDQDTSGLLILAKNPKVLGLLQNLFKTRQIKKTYLALVLGKLAKEQGKIESFISRDTKKDRQKSRLLALEDKEKIARTSYRVLNVYTLTIQNKKYDISFLELKPETGRTHQLRVQLKNFGHPILGDQIYSIKESRLISKFFNIPRQMLHAGALEFKHPLTFRLLSFKIKPSSNFTEILAKIGSTP